MYLARNGIYIQKKVLKGSKNLILEIDLKIILLDHQNNYIGSLK